MKFVPFHHRSWVCSGNFEVFHSVNGTRRQSSHSWNSCSPLQIRAGISGSSLSSEDRRWQYQLYVCYMWLESWKHCSVVGLRLEKKCGDWGKNQSEEWAWVLTVEHVFVWSQCYSVFCKFLGEGLLAEHWSWSPNCLLFSKTKTLW